MTYPAAIQFLYDLQWFGAKPGLANPRRLAALAGNAQERLRFIHVAGTNGKGSTCAMLEGIYRAAGLRTGLFTSPHLVAFGERIQVNRRPVGEDDVTRLVEEMRGWLKEFTKDEHPTFFEVVTVMALRYFAEQNCDLVIWETGLGGRLDATNIVTPLASVITNIQFDHQKWLGDTLEQIAFEKAGIIKPGVPVITAADDAGALRVIAETASANHAPLSVVTAAQTDEPPLRGLKLSLLGEHQRLNAAVAARTVRAVADKIPVDDETIRAGLSRVEWAGRLQVVERASGQKILLDGAHNVAGAESLRAALAKNMSISGTDPFTLILGILQDKDWLPICRILAPLAVRILLAPVNSRRSASPPELLTACRAANPAAEVAECESLADALERARGDGFVVVTGSLYLVGEAMELLRLPSAKARNERGLNEWGAVVTGR